MRFLCNPVGSHTMEYDCLLSKWRHGRTYSDTDQHIFVECKHDFVYIRYLEHILDDNQHTDYRCS